MLADRTDPSGSAIIANVPVGMVTLAVTPADLGTPSSISQLLTRAGTFRTLAQPPNQLVQSTAIPCGRRAGIEATASVVAVLLATGPS